MSGVTKRFGAFTALDSVDLEVQAGAIHAIVGENGAGKTTLMRVLYGALHAEPGGHLEVHGTPATYRTSEGALAAGIGMVSQHYGIIGELTCLQNLIVGAEGGPFLHGAALRDRADGLAKRMGFSFDWNAEASTLSPGSAQKLEILKLLWRNSRIMILDEPTAMLSPADADALFESLHRLASEGATILVVTHRLPEVLLHCQRVTVLRGGKKVADLDVSKTDAAELSRLIVGESLEELPIPVSAATSESALSAVDLTVKGYRGDDAVKGIALHLAAGEVLGIAGVDGNGQRELIQALCGWVPFHGSLKIGSLDASHLSVKERIEAGLRLIPEDRLDEGLVEGWSLEQNAILGLHWMPPFAQKGTLNPEARAGAAEAMARRFNTKFSSLGQAIGGLSGGNQQRFVAGRALSGEPRVILAFQPARGLDLKATREVYQAIREACTGGAAALIVSFDLDELLTHCDRVVAMNRGKLFEPGQEDSRDRDAIGRLMVAT